MARHLAERPSIEDRTVRRTVTVASVSRPGHTLLALYPRSDDGTATFFLTNAAANELRQNLNALRECGQLR